MRKASCPTPVSVAKHCWLHPSRVLEGVELGGGTRAFPADEDAGVERVVGRGAGGQQAGQPGEIGAVAVCGPRRLPRSLGPGRQPVHGFAFPVGDCAAHGELGQDGLVAQAADLGRQGNLSAASAVRAHQDRAAVPVAVRWPARAVGRHSSAGHAELDERVPGRGPIGPSHVRVIKRQERGRRQQRVGRGQRRPTSTGGTLASLRPCGPRSGSVSPPASVHTGRTSRPVTTSSHG